MNNYKEASKGTVVSMWEGKNSTYWALISYWIGVGYQNVERQVTQNTYEGWLIDNE